MKIQPSVKLTPQLISLFLSMPLERQGPSRRMVLPSRFNSTQEESIRVRPVERFSSQSVPSLR
jgi:hypothetical protein